MKKQYLDKKVVLYQEFRTKLSELNMELSDDMLHCFNTVADNLVTIENTDYIIVSPEHTKLSFQLSCNGIKANLSYNLKSPTVGLCSVMNNNRAFITSFMNINEFLNVYNNVVQNYGTK